MLNFLHKPYPFNDDLKHNAKIILLISVVVLVFLVFFQPIEIASLTRSQIFYLAVGLAATTFLSLTFNLIVIPSLLSKQFDSTRWNVKREIIWNFWNFITISSGFVFFYSKISGVIGITLIDMLKIFFISLIPISVLIVVNQYRLIRANLRSAEVLNRKLLEYKERKEKLVHFESDYKSDQLVIKADSVILVHSADNYIEVYYESSGMLKKQLVRCSLKKAESILMEFDSFFRCHRSYIINVNRIVEITGSSQGYDLFLELVDFPVSVSQKYVGEFKKMGIFRP